MHSRPRYRSHAECSNCGLDSSFKKFTPVHHSIWRNNFKKKTSHWVVIRGVEDEEKIFAFLGVLRQSSNMFRVAKKVRWEFGDKLCLVLIDSKFPEPMIFDTWLDFLLVEWRKKILFFSHEEEIKTFLLNHRYWWDLNEKTCLNKNFCLKVPTQINSCWQCGSKIYAKRWNKLNSQLTLMRLLLNDSRGVHEVLFVNMLASELRKA